MSVPAGVADLIERHGNRHVGLVVGMLHGGEREVTVRGRAAADAIFEIGSITKVFTALLLVRLARHGTVALEERVWPNEAATLADLASHTAGLPRLPKGMVALSLRRRHDPYARFGDARLAAATRALRLRPRGRVRYSNFGAGLLGRLLATRAGVSYAQLVEEEICRPLGLADTSVDVAPDSLHRLAQGHDRRGRPVPHWHFDALAGAGALHSTAADLLSFLSFQLAPARTDLGAAAVLTQQPRARRGRLEVGLGWMRTPLRGADGHVLWHNGGTAGFRSFAAFVPERATGAVVLSNCARSTDRLGMRLVETLR